MPAFDVPANLAFDTYDELVAAINDWLDRADLTGIAQQLIALAESRMRRELSSYFLETSAAVSLANGLGDLPADFGTIRRVAYQGRTLDSIATFSDEIAGAAPIGYSLERGKLRVWPAGDYAVTILYQATLPALSTSNISNDLLQQHPDLYFYGSMLFANGYLADDNRASLFKQLWDEAIQSAKEYMLRQRFSGPLVPRFRFSVP